MQKNYSYSSRTAAIVALLCCAGTSFSIADTPLESPPLPTEARLQAVPFTQVKITDNFWAPRQEINRTVSIAANLQNLEKAGNIKNLILSAEGKHEGYSGPVFMDSDLYKGLEAAAYTLATDYSTELDAELDRIIQIIANAQGKDGYINSYFTVVEPDKRWTNLRDCHELYCIGHMIEAAVAHYQATGKTNFLNVATKAADCLDNVFGDAPGKRAGYAGHPEIELALMKLWKATNDDKYLKLARFFTIHRGEKFFAKEHNTPLDKYSGDYWQDLYPIYDTPAIMGHAVRATYLLSGCVDVGRETQDENLLRMVRRVWNNTVYKNLYITGGIGPSASNEGFTENYDLPNASAYQETCASVAMILLNQRLGLLYGDTKYIDVMEQTFYNGFLSGVSLSGDKFFYVNPLASSGNHHRSAWFGCACCPPNVARTMASLGGYIYAQNEDSLFVNMFVAGSVTTKIGDKEVKMNVETDYPWDGKVKFTMDMDEPVQFNLRIRIPSWAMNTKMKSTCPTPCGERYDHGYASINRIWKKGEIVTYDFTMQPQMILANPNVKADTGMIALRRGPIVYCLEGMDQSTPLKNIYLPAETEITSEFEKDLLGGVTVLKAKARTSNSMLNWTHRLYQPLPPNTDNKTDIKAIPYYAWDNRQACPMQVWIPLSPVVENYSTEGFEGSATTELSFTSGNCYPNGIHDGKSPTKSNQHPGELTHFWPHKGGEEWIAYHWENPIETASSRLFWFDDTGVGECRPPVSWVLEYQNENGEWIPVETQSPYSVELDKWIEVNYKPVKTKALRVKVKQQPKFAVGIHEWQVLPLE